MSREKVSTEFDCRRIHVIVHQSASDNLAVVHSSSLFGAESYSGQRERKVSNINQRFVNSCLANLQVFTYTQSNAPYNLICA